MRTPSPDEQRVSEARALARTTPLAPQRWGFLPTPTFWRQPGALDHAKWLFIVILVVGALPYAAAGLPPMTGFVAFGGLCYFGLGLLERYVRAQADRRSERAIRGASDVDEAPRRGADQGRGGV
jgi:hypothetical protein